MGCVDSTVQETQKPKMKKKTIVYTRLSSKFSVDEVRQISDEERRNGVKPAYACPICFLYFSSIIHFI